MSAIATMIGSFIEPLQVKEMSESELQLLQRVKQTRLHLSNFERPDRALRDTIRMNFDLHRNALTEKIGLSHWWLGHAGTRDHLKSLFQLFCNPIKHRPRARTAERTGCSAVVISCAPDSIFEEEESMRKASSNDALLCRTDREKHLCAELTACLKRTPPNSFYIFDEHQNGRRLQVESLLDQLQTMKSRLKYQMQASNDREHEVVPIATAIGYQTLFSK